VASSPSSFLLTAVVLTALFDHMMIHHYHFCVTVPSGVHKNVTFVDFFGNVTFVDLCNIELYSQNNPMLHLFHHIIHWSQEV
jgi:hypothetical protein